MTLINQNVVIKETQYRCRGCRSSVMRYIDTTPDALIAKYTCSCVNNRGELTGPQFPLFKEEQQ